MRLARSGYTPNFSCLIDLQARRIACLIGEGKARGAHGVEAVGEEAAEWCATIAKRGEAFDRTSAEQRTPIDDSPGPGPRRAS